MLWTPAPHLERNQTFHRTPEFRHEKKRGKSCGPDSKVRGGNHFACLRSAGLAHRLSQLRLPTRLAQVGRIFAKDENVFRPFREKPTELLSLRTHELRLDLSRCEATCLVLPKG